MDFGKIKIEIWSDIVCPFCYLGKKKLNMVLEKIGALDKAEIIWHSYQLAPDFPRDRPMTSLEYLTVVRNYPAAHLEAMHEYLRDQGRLYGIDFRFDKALTFNTFDAHRLWRWSDKYKRSDETKEALFRAHFTEGIDLSQSENLLDVIQKAGLDRNEASVILGSDAYEQAVEMDRYQAMQLGIRGVPFFLVNDKMEISGAQDDRVFENVLLTALKTSQLFRFVN